MDNYTIFTDATADLTESLVKEAGISIIPMEYFVDGKPFLYEGMEFDAKGFYSAVAKGASVSTTQINPSSFEAAFRPELEKGQDILYISLSSGLSGSYNSSIIAANGLREEFPERKIHMIDSLAAAVGEALLVFTASRLRAGGKSIDETYEKIMAERKHVCMLFTVDDLNHLRRGGRISSATAILGGALNIKPILRVNDEGRIESFSKARGKKGAVSKLVELMSELILPDECDLIFISHGDAPEEADRLKERISEVFPGHRIITTSIGPVIGSHTGQKALCLIFHGKHR